MQKEGSAQKKKYGRVTICEVCWFNNWQLGIFLLNHLTQNAPIIDTLGPYATCGFGQPNTSENKQMIDEENLKVWFNISIQPVWTSCQPARYNSGTHSHDLRWVGSRFYSWVELLSFVLILLWWNEVTVVLRGVGLSEKAKGGWGPLMAHCNVKSSCQS